MIGRVAEAREAGTMHKIHEPWGMGIYYRDLNGKDLQKKARIAADHKVRHALILAGWQEEKKGKYSFRHINDLDLLERACDEFKNVGIMPAFWFYPWAGHEQEMLDWLGQALMRCAGRVHGLLEDGELGSKWKRKGRRSRGRSVQPEAIPGRGKGEEGERRRQAVDLMEGMLDLMFEGMWMGATAYGIARYHPNFPWAEFLRYGVKSPQLYGADAKENDMGMGDWKELAHDPEMECEWVPSVGLYGDRDEGLLKPTLDLWHAYPQIQGMFAWSEPSISIREWRTLLGVIQEWGWALDQPIEDKNLPENLYENPPY